MYDYVNKKSGHPGRRYIFVYLNANIKIIEVKLSPALIAKISSSVPLGVNPRWDIKPVNAVTEPTNIL